MHSQPNICKQWTEVEWRSQIQNISGLSHELITHKLLHCTSWVLVYSKCYRKNVMLATIIPPPSLWAVWATASKARKTQPFWTSLITSIYRARRKKLRSGLLNFVCAVAYHWACLLADPYCRTVKKVFVRGFVKFGTSVAYQFYLNLPEALTQPRIKTFSHSVDINLFLVIRSPMVYRVTTINVI